MCAPDVFAATHIRSDVSGRNYISITAMGRIQYDVRRIVRFDNYLIVETLYG